MGVCRACITLEKVNVCVTKGSIYLFEGLCRLEGFSRFCIAWRSTGSRVASSRSQAGTTRMVSSQPQLGAVSSYLSFGN